MREGVVVWWLTRVLRLLCVPCVQWMQMADADMSNLTATPTKDATPEDIAVRLASCTSVAGFAQRLFLMCF